MQMWHRLRTIAIFSFLLVEIHIFGITAERTCHQCRGINCQRTSYEAIEKCTSNFDSCVNVFIGQTILAQGCLEQLPKDLRTKCESSRDNAPLSECYKCNTNQCNTLASSSFECIQCDSNIDANCRSNSSSLKPSRCKISRSPTENCFVKQEENRVLRGCLLTVAEQRSCLSTEDCMICQPSELGVCNSIDVEDSGSGQGGGGSEGSGSGTGGDGSEGSGTDQGGGSEGSGSGQEGSGSEGSGSGTGNTSSADSSSNFLVKIPFYIVNIYITYLWRKINK